MGRKSKTPDFFDMSSGAQLRRRRIELGWTLDEAAQRLGINKSTLSSRETGREHCPESFLRTYAQIMELDETTFLEKKESSPFEVYMFDQAIRFFEDRLLLKSSQEKKQQTFCMIQEERLISISLSYEPQMMCTAYTRYLDQALFLKHVKELGKAVSIVEKGTALWEELLSIERHLRAVYESSWQEE